MKLVYIVIGIVILSALVFIVWRLLQGSGSPVPADRQVETSKSESAEFSDAFLGLRSQALNFPPDQFGIDKNSKTPTVYGVVMDWNVGKGILTFTSFSSGDASMYTSTGGGVIGGVGHKNVSDAAKSFVKKAEEYVGRANRSHDIATPGNGAIKFFILTPQGRFVANEELKNFDNGTSEWLELFVEANKLITEIRTIEENRK